MQGGALADAMDTHYFCQMNIRVLLYNCCGLYLGQSAGDKAHCIVVDNLLEKVINKLLDNKANGLDHISAKHLKSTSMRIAPLLAVCFTGFIIHSLLQDSMLSILLVPVI